MNVRKYAGILQMYSRIALTRGSVFCIPTNEENNNTAAASHNSSSIVIYLCE